ncbi:hypothetical protein SAMN05428997_101211 [Bosea sp. CRIB-10]|nr:hypothetical protein SAMN05428997_101211 [Bosea sp. CRIB-10]
MSRITRIEPAGAMGATPAQIAVALTVSIDFPGLEPICEAAGAVTGAGYSDGPLASKECL